MKILMSAILFAYPFFSGEISDTDSKNAAVDVSDMIQSYFEHSELPENELQSLYGFLSYLHENPVNINETDRNGVALLPFLSSSQKEDILSYLYIHGKMESLGELQFIESLDYRDRQFISLFVYAGNRTGRTGSVPEKSKRVYNSAVTNISIPLYRRAGFYHYSESELLKYPNRKYSGNAISNSIRYSFNSGDNVKIGFTMDKDPGEASFNKHIPLYDYVSLYFQMQKAGRLSNIVAGDFDMSCGQGLILKTDFTMGKTSVLNTCVSDMIKAHTSVSESGYFRGACLSMKCSDFLFTLLLSSKRVDAVLDNTGAVSSFKTDGYHRTALELSKRHNTIDNTSVMRIHWKNDNANIGCTLSADYFDRILSFRKFPVSLAFAEGSLIWNAGLDYGVRRGLWSLSGETAVYCGRHFATIDRLQLRLSGNYVLNLIYRNYGSGYFCFHGNSLNECGMSGEQGIYLGLERNGKIKNTFYADLFCFQGNAQSTVKPCYGYDLRYGLSYISKDRNTGIDVSCRFKSRRNTAHNAESSGKFKVTCNNRLTRNMALKSQLNAAYCPVNGFRGEYGLALTEQLSYKPDKHSLSGSISVSWFMTDSWNTSLRIYENGLPYSYNIQTLDGRGLRNSLVVKYSPVHSVSVNFKFGSTVYLDREFIGTSQQKIHSFHKEDISLQFAIKF